MGMWPCFPGLVACSEGETSVEVKAGAGRCEQLRDAAREGRFSAPCVTQKDHQGLLFNLGGERVGEWGGAGGC